MMLNGLGFTGRTLYMYSEYFSDKPLDSFIGPNIEASDINDDTLDRCLYPCYLILQSQIGKLWQVARRKIEA